MKQQIFECLRTAYSASLQKGKQLFRQGKVTGFYKGDRDSEYIFIVQGTFPYEVKVQIDPHNGLKSSCSCPYDYGGLCKHQVAALLELERSYLDLQKDETQKPAKHAEVKKVRPLPNDRIISNDWLKDFFKPSLLSSINSSYFDVEIESFEGPNFMDVLVSDHYDYYAQQEVQFVGQKDGVTAICSCKNAKMGSYCRHVAIALINFMNKSKQPQILMFLNNQFYYQKIREGLKSYGLEHENDTDKVLSIEVIDGTIGYKLSEEYEGIVPIDTEFGQAFVKDFTHKLSTTSSPRFHLQLIGAEDKIDEQFGYGIVIYVDKYEGSRYQVKLIRGKLNKSKDKLISSLKQVSWDDIKDLNEHQQELLKYSVRSEVDSEKNYRIDDEGLELQYFVNILNVFNGLFEYMNSEDFLFIDHSFENFYNYKVSRRDLVPVTYADHVARLEFELNENERFVELYAFLILGNEKIALNYQSYDELFFGDVLVLHNQKLYLLENVQSVNTIKLFLANIPLKSLRKQRNGFIKNVVLPLTSYHHVNFDKMDKVKVHEASPKPLRKALYVSGVGEFVMFAPVVEYAHGHQQNVFESGTQIIDSEGELVRINRDEEYERIFIDYLRQLHPNFQKQIPHHFFHLKINDLLEDFWFIRTFEKFTELGIELYGLDKLKNFKYKPVKGSISSSVSSEIDWFEAKISVAFGDTKVSLSEVKKAILKKEQFIRLSDDSVGVLPQEWLKRFEQLFRHGEVKGDKVRISSRKFMIIETLFSKIDDSKLVAELAEKKKLLESFASIKKVRPPKEIKATLRAYQLEGLNWLNFLKEFQWGGILADDMGLGKTLQVLSHLARQKNKKRNTSLIVVPTTLIFNWDNEIKKFYPSMKPLFHHGNKRVKDTDSFANYDVVITSYGTMVNDIEALQEFNFNYVILDESQAIKNAQSLRFKAACLLKAQHKIALTGTPIENNTFDLYAQMQFVNPGFLGSAKSFKDNFSTPIDREGSVAIAAELRKMIHPFMIRRTKEQVATELPPKTEEVLYCTMEKEQRKIYDAFRNKYRDYLMGKIEKEGLEKSKIYVLEGLTKLRQICDSPAILSDKENYGNQSVKIEELTRNIEEKTGDHKIVVFSQFVSMLKLIEKQLKKDGVTYEYLDGQSSPKARQESVQVFQENDQCRVFLISLKAGGTGLNLTAADYVFLVDPWWNPAVENQAIDRCYRIGQDKKVFAYRMICKDTVEEKILSYQQKKQSIAADIIQAEANFMKQLSVEDIKGLFD